MTDRPIDPSLPSDQVLLERTKQRVAQAVERALARGALVPGADGIVHIKNAELDECDNLWVDGVRID
ncbi:hypothetical protein GCM10010412_073150 [Nonomuraea recticatena]|uniref:Uncharacterized protein n=1 Tax=Nonomuraea recticatena TaxID=46178 RepID=A0ABP6F7H2_9ACTN